MKLGRFAGGVVLALTGAVAAGAWSALAIAYFLFEPGIALWTTLVTIAAFATEGFLWVCAGVLGWTVFSGRRRILAQLKRRLFG
ncbi:MAG: hypothetical protein JNJ73_04380 [Hyphomonadaceae bacterium]|nr:hypothetical protein [Hyphomonadaceae bacterium]